MITSPDLTKSPIPQLVRHLALPVGIGFFFNTMFNVVDTWYAGQISTQAVAAVSLSFPVFFLIIAIGSGISTGATALMGHALGSGNREEAREYAHQTIIFALAHALVMSLCGLIGAPTLFRLMGASGEYLSLAVGYMSALFAGAPFFILNQAQNGILNSSGDTRSYRNFLVVAFILNLIYDPWFIYGGFGLPPLGLTGIAWGTVAIQAMGSLYLYLQSRKTGLIGGIGFRAYIPRWQRFKQLAELGFPSSMTMLTVAVGIFVITWYVGRFGRDAVAAYGIATRIEQLVMLPVMGLNVATLALVAQNAGARQFLRVKEAIRSALLTGVSLMSIGTLLLFFLAEPLMKLFSSDPLVIAPGRDYLRIAAFVLHAYVILYINSFALQGLKRPRFALLIGIFRQFAAPIPVFWLFAIRFEWGVTGVWGGIALITWLAALLSLWYIRRTMHEILKEA